MPPRLRKTQPINPAVAALGVGVQPDRWEPRQLITSMSNRYTQLMQQAEEAKLREQKNRIRALSAGAYELALIIADFYQYYAIEEDFQRWSRRRDRAYAVAYARSSIVSSATGDAHVQPESPAPGT